MGAKVIIFIIASVMLLTLFKVGVAITAVNSYSYEWGRPSVATPAHKAERVKSASADPVRGDTHYYEINAIRKEIHDKESYTITAVVTAYSKAETCPDVECITASGRSPVVGETVACPRSLSFGTAVQIDSKIYRCDDRTHYRYNGRFDIYTASYEEAIDFGKQTKKVIIYK